MERQGVIRTGFFIFFVILCFVVIFFLANSRAVDDKNSYRLGEKVRLDFSGIDSYKVKIATPSTIFVREGKGNFFVFKPEEIGKYRIELLRGEKEEIYEFEVVGGEGTENETNQINNFSEEVQFVDERVSEKNDERFSEELSEIERIVINKPVRKVITESFSEKKSKVKVKIPAIAENIKAYGLTNDERKELETEIGFSLFEEIVGKMFFGRATVTKKTAIIKEAEGDVEIEYFLPGPVAYEEQVSEREKRVVVSDANEFGYENVLAYTESKGL